MELLKRNDGKVSLSQKIEALRALKERSGAIVVHIPDNENYALSHAQLRLWVSSQFAGGNVAYNMPSAYLLEGYLDVDAFKRAFTRLVDRHESLRTTFLLVNGEPRQRVQGENGFIIEEIDARAEADPEGRARALATEELTRAFDLEHGPLMRAKLIQISENRWVFLITLHHIVSDGWSIEVLVKEILSLYEAYRQGREALLPVLAIQYRDYAVWQNAQLTEGKLEKSRQYWLKKLGGELPVLNLPTDYVRPAVKSYRGAVHCVELGAEDLDRLKELAQANEATLFMFLMTLVNVLLFRYTEQEDIIIGTPIAGREHGQLKDQIGFYVGTLAVRNQIKADESFAGLLRRVKQTMLEGYEHLQYPFDKLVEEVVMTRDMSRYPLFDVMVVLNEVLTQPKFTEVKLTPLRAEHAVSKFDLTFKFEDRDGRLGVQIEYSTDLFDTDRIERIAGHLQVLIQSVIDDPQVSVGQIAILPKWEKHRLLVDFTDTVVEYPKDQTAPQLFEEQAKKTPDNIAVVFEQQKMTYVQLNNKANKLARQLRKQGIRSDQLVAIMVDRSLELIIGILGILKSGGAYVPIDPGYPRSRIEYMVKDCRAKIVLTQAKYRTLLSESVEKVIDIDCVLSGQCDERNLSRINKPENLAYSIYTSGSTGEPKGVMIEHRNLVNLIYSLTYYKQVKRIALVAPVVFDGSVKQIFGALFTGATLIMASENARYDPFELMKFYRKNSIELSDGTPSHLAMLQRLPESERVDFPDIFLIGGEKLMLSNISWLKDKNGKRPRIVNVYGPTECCVDATTHEIMADKIVYEQDLIPIGKPIANTRIYILDGERGLTPLGFLGEIFIGGAQVGRGYLGQRKQTAESFVPDPFIEGKRIYRTGDLGYWNNRGEVVFFARNDTQAKIRGHRIELGEVESALQKHPEVKEAVVVVRPDGTGDIRLVAYLVLQDPSALSELASFLRTKLPIYMVPALFVPMAALPLTPNGKINRNGLPDPEVQPQENENDVPQGKIETDLAIIYEKVLAIKKIGRSDNFFELGGHSLKAVRIVSLIHSELSLPLGVTEVFRNPSIQELARYIALRQGNERAIIEHATDSCHYRMSHAQKWLWVLSQIEAGSVTYNMPRAYVFKGDLDAFAFKRALVQVVKRHESLRTTFVIINGDPCQKVHDAFNFVVESVDLRTKIDQEKTALVLAAEEHMRAFDLERGPLIRAKLLQMGEQRWVFLLTLHHTVGDGWSLFVLEREVSQVYATYLHGKEDQLPKLEIQYRDYAVWENRQFEEGKLGKAAQYWHKKLGGVLPVLEFPTDRVRPATKSYHGRVNRFELKGIELERLKQLAQSNGATLFMVLAAVVKVMLYYYCEIKDIIIGTWTSNRDHGQLKDQIGIYAGLLPLRDYIIPDKEFVELLQQVKQTTLEAFEYQSYPFNQIVNDLVIKLPVNRHPIFDVMVTVNDRLSCLTLGELEINPLEVAQLTSRFDLSFHFLQQDGELLASIEYATDLFTVERIEQTAYCLRELLRLIGLDPRLNLKTIIQSLQVAMC